MSLANETLGIEADCRPITLLGILAQQHHVSVATGVVSQNPKSGSGELVQVGTHAFAVRGVCHLAQRRIVNQLKI